MSVTGTTEQQLQPNNARLSFNIFSRRLIHWMICAFLGFFTTLRTPWRLNCTYLTNGHDKLIHPDCKRKLLTWYLRIAHFSWMWRNVSENRGGSSEGERLIMAESTGNWVYKPLLIKTRWHQWLYTDTRHAKGGLECASILTVTHTHTRSGTVWTDCRYETEHWIS